MRGSRLLKTKTFQKEEMNYEENSSLQTEMEMLHTFMY